MPWFVLYTQPRNEKKVTERLEKLGITAYCPMTIQVRQWSDRKKKVEVPLLNSYVFVQLAEANRKLVFEVPGIVRYLFWLGEPAIVRDEEIKTLQNWLAHDFAKLEVSALKPGDTIILKEGAFKNQEALIKTISKTKMQLVLTSLGLLVTLTTQVIDPELI
ncbi:MAG: UpxY family transcription antiterminator [Flavobacterium sp.]|nr:UpxY family transcription antiterminator [Flavobacterium sp.]